jgi:hypothetical protein
MYDRPTLTELITAVRQHLENEVIPATKALNHKLYFQTLVAVNVLRIAERELILAEPHLQAEWKRLNALLGEQPLPNEPTARRAALAERNRALCAAIRAGHYDSSQDLLRHLKACAAEQLEVANPKWLQADLGQPKERRSAG